MKNYIKALLTLSILQIIHFANAQTDSAKLQTEIPIKFSLLVEQISLPTFQNHSEKIEYGFNIGTEFKYSVKSKIELIQTADFYFYTHQLYGSSFVLSSLFDFRYKPGNLNIDVNLGPGYMLFYNYSPIYKKENGTYQKASNLQSKFCGIGSIALSYNIKSFKPFISYGIIVETSFVNSSSPILPHQVFQVGSYYRIKNLNK